MREHPAFTNSADVMEITEEHFNNTFRFQVPDGEDAKNYKKKNVRRAIENAQPVFRSNINQPRSFG